MKTEQDETKDYDEANCPKNEPFKTLWDMYHDAECNTAWAALTDYRAGFRHALDLCRCTSQEHLRDIITSGKAAGQLHGITTAVPREEMLPHSVPKREEVLTDETG